MMISREGIEFIQNWEGFRSKAYKDVAGIWTIGFGTTTYFDGNTVKKGDIISLDHALSYLMYECDDISLKLNNWVNGKLNQHQFDAVVSLAYNIGIQALKTSTLLKEIIKGKPITEDYFTRWNKAHVDGKLVTVVGLLNRRRSEFALYSGSK